ncbi:MAG: hypothetical protein ACOVRK_11270 [Chryseobacterium taeanense]
MEIIDVCYLIEDRPSVMAFKIPDKKCEPDGRNFTMEQEIHDRFSVNAKMMISNSFKIQKWNFFEVVYQSALCGTVAILFLVDKQKRIIHTNAYEIDPSDFDFRMSKRQGQIVLYRKVKRKQKVSTISFELDTTRHRINSFVDDGLSLW